MWGCRALLFVWELPQNLLGLYNLRRQQRRNLIESIRFDNERWMVQLKDGHPISLGLFVFWADERSRFVTDANTNLRHEYGHSIQSRILGPLYIPIVGVASVLRAYYAGWYRRRYGRNWGRYYEGFPEAWADHLVGVKSLSPGDIQADVPAEPNPPRPSRRER